jgi:hypothetical protein
MNLRSRLEARATAAAESVVEGVQTRSAGLHQGLDTLLHDDGGELGIESFLLALVRTVRDEEAEDDRSKSDVLESSRHRRRRLGMLSFGAGPMVGVATQLVELYSETATVCDLVDVLDLELSDQEIASHMLLLWSITDDLDDALAMIEGSGERTVAGVISGRFRDVVGERIPEKLTKWTAIKALWNSRKAASEAGQMARDMAGHGSIKAILFTGRQMKRFIKRAEAQLTASQPSADIEPAV